MNVINQIKEFLALEPMIKIEDNYYKIICIYDECYHVRIKSFPFYRSVFFNQIEDKTIYFDSEVNADDANRLIGENFGTDWNYA